MRFVTFELNGRSRPGMVFEETVLDISSIGFASLIGVIASGSEGRAKIENFAYEPSADAKYPLNTVKLLAPVPKPPKLICVGLNYRDHAAETGARLPVSTDDFQQISHCGDRTGRRDRATQSFENARL